MNYKIAIAYRQLCRMYDWKMSWEGLKAFAQIQQVRERWVT